MKDLIDFISQPWPWYVAGPIISVIMFVLFFLGKRFGISSNLRTICSVLGAGKSCEFFDFDWKSQRWNLVFALGMMIGGAITSMYLTSEDPVQISEATKNDLMALGLGAPKGSMVPDEIFNWEMLLTVKGFIMLVIGGFLVGFGTRYAGGCTSGHAISGLSDLQLPSLIAVVGFFIGGLFVTYLVLPYLLTL
ncbi:YeeE/YedE family protein [Marinoscillum sp. MHG1-6]|uniref:YeeE/YedE family protein n=1 Tax=Marinoscillum sp. MHG1-6 TaxID=2959627 RepID=UPI0021582859|nr:YeeE/YedE family protein [Marinoscillum sp. MHG1-6]